KKRPYVKRAISRKGCERSARITGCVSTVPGRSSPPNGVRLSCGAGLECSQTQLYHTAIQHQAVPPTTGRRQLQALVRRPVPGRVKRNGYEAAEPAGPERNGKIPDRPYPCLTPSCPRARYPLRIEP